MLSELDGTRDMLLKQYRNDVEAAKLQYEKALRAAQERLETKIMPQTIKSTLQRRYSGGGWVCAGAGTFGDLRQKDSKKSIFRAMKRSFADRGETGFYDRLFRGTDKRRGIGAAPGPNKAAMRTEEKSFLKNGLKENDKNS